MSNIEIYQNTSPSLESYWRSIILFGANVASYKFALAKSLLEIAPTQKTEVTLEELAVPFSKHICEHIAVAPKQTTSKSSQFLKTCQDFNRGLISKEVLWDVTIQKGFNHVIDAFHVVNGGNIPVKFYEKSYLRGVKKIILRDALFGLLKNQNYRDLRLETEARWNLVETAWEVGVSKNLLDVKYDEDKKVFFINNNYKRKDVTSSINALNGYQKGKCFYCFGDITVEKGSENKCDVDHFFPHILQHRLPNVNIDGVWNLVLACPNCNRGEQGKFAKVPVRKYLKRLSKRNEFLISSHHPLRDTLMKQTGTTIARRQKFIENVDQFAIEHLIHRWDIKQIGEEVF